MSRYAASPGDDFLSVISDSLTGDEMLSAAFLLLFAGYENVVHVLGNGLVELLSRPSLRDEAMADLPSTVDEMIRYSSPAQLAIRRFPTEDFPAGNATIPAGDTVMLALSSAHRDSAAFTDPDTFDINRNPNPHLGYGHGLGPPGRCSRRVRPGRAEPEP